ncbi:ribonuclease H-like domain-containing protein [Tanacetum coccineum]|uniref:Ribonuclease H-like domain-containing protein n=1 Tax=Tanacetum coccineum TaxID=301880 RepID=A0ABQ4WB79_9ASTR
MSGTHDEIPPPPPPQETQQKPTQQTPQTVSTIKLPILKKGEYDIWAMKIEHYLAHTDYPIWEVIQNGNGPVSVTTDTSGQIKILPPKSAEEVVARERERKARTTLLMAIPEDHLAKFHKMTDAKEMWNAIKSRFGGNDESKKMQNFLDHEEQTRMDSLSFDDLYNNLRVFENDVKGSTASSYQTSQQLAFVSYEITNSTNEVSNAYGCVQLFWGEPVGFDKTKVECFKCHKTGHFARECRTKEENRRRDGWNTGNREGRRTSNRDESITGKKEGI